VKSPSIPLFLRGKRTQFPGTVRDFLYVGDVTTYQVALDNGFELAALRPNDAPGRARDSSRSATG
jgi:hypothetical protein